MPEGESEAGWIQVLEGSTFMLSDAQGDVFRGTIAGLFHEDTRFLDRFVLTISGQRPFLLTSSSIDYYSAAFFMTNPPLGAVAPHSLSVQRFRSIGDGLSEVIVISNHAADPVEIEVRIACGADFADLFEVKEGNFTKRGVYETVQSSDSQLVFSYAHRDFRVATRIHSTEPARMEGNDLVYEVKIEPRATWKTKIEVGIAQGEKLLEPPSQEARGASRALKDWREASQALHSWWLAVPKLDAGWEVFELVHKKSIEDLAALRLYADVEGNEYALPAAGLPWFMAMFGRDTLITSYQSMLVGPELARGALKALAALQGKEMNDFKDEEPGKILHEIRFGELTVLGDKPHRPYYGTADATPLFLILLSEYWRFTRDDATVISLRDNALRALEWIDRYGDRDGDGYVEYETRSSQGLENQCWKDSWNGLLFADGTLPARPIASSEIQGYCYDAKSRLAEIAEEVWKDAALAERLRREAASLFDKFNEDFWIDERGGYYAIALDRDKRRVDSLTSNIGHLLWSGIVPEERAKLVAKQLLGPALHSGWGVRTMSSDDLGYNPIGYHIGTVWPHDNSIVSAGLYRCGMRDEANRIATTMIEAASFTAFRLPEVFAGYPRRESRFPVRYPTASSPQAWATAAPFLWLRLMVGLEARDGALVADPVVPRKCGRLEIRGLHAFGKRYDVIAEGTEASIEEVG